MRTISIEAFTSTRSTAIINQMKKRQAMDVLIRNQSMRYKNGPVNLLPWDYQCGSLTHQQQQLLYSVTPHDFLAA